LKEGTKRTGVKDFVKQVRFRKGKFLLSVLLLLIVHLASAQLQRFPVKRSSSVLSSAKPNKAGRTKQVTPLALPFWDDFSKPYKVYYPDTSLWEAGFSIWVSDGMAINPPTLNVATFDGLDSAGVAYNPNDILANGFRDSLVSRKINLSETGAKPVAVSARASVFFSFMYEWGGNGEAPDPNDYLQVEFKNKTGLWEIVMKIKPKDSFKKDVFYDTLMQVNGDQFFHNAFQFRFRSFGRQSGPYDTWHVDYVYLNKGRNASDFSFPDQAITSRLTSLFEHSYRALPYRHFIKDSSFITPKFNIYNLRKDPPDVIGYVTEGTFVNYVDGISTKTFISNLGGTDTAGVNANGSGTILPFEKKTVSLKHLPKASDATQFNPNADSLFFKLKVKLFTGDYIDPKSGGLAADYDPNYLPMDFRINDTISSNYALKDYYAYDDGVAEYAAGLIQPGNLIAYEFDLAEGIKQDTLLGFDIYFPPFGISNNQTIDFFIYHQKDSTGLPKDEPWLRIPARLISRKGINEFQRIKFIPALLIDEKKFYIGWKQPVSGKLVVGLDISNDTGDKMFVNTNNFWYQNNTVNGSLMIRPIFGSGLVDAQVGVEEPPQKLAIYPNPSQGNFYIEGKVDQLQILSTTGQPIPFQKEQSDDRTFVQLNQPAGLYVVRCTTDKKIKSYKIIITK
jgi:hypothetical protein